MGNLAFSQLKCDFASVATDIINGEQVVLRDGSLTEAVRASISIPGIFTPVLIEGRYLVDGGLINEVPVSVCRDMGAEYVIGINVVPEPGKVLYTPHKGRQYQVSELELGETGYKAESSTTPATHSGSLRSRIVDIENATKVFFMSHRQRDRKGRLRSPLKLKRDRVLRSRAGSPRLTDILSQTMTIAEYRIAVENLKDADIAISPDLEHIGFWQFSKAAEAITAGERAARMVLERNNLKIPVK